MPTARDHTLEIVLVEFLGSLSRRDRAALHSSGSRPNLGRYLVSNSFDLAGLKPTWRTGPLVAIAGQRDVPSQATGLAA